MYAQDQTVEQRNGVEVDAPAIAIIFPGPAFFDRPSLS
jgi:hypothetical protein